MLLTSPLSSPLKNPVRDPLRPVSGGGTPSGYDIILAAGQSNMFFGLTKSGADTSDPSIYQFYYGGAGAANTVSAGSANDPLDHPDTSGVAGPAIGHTVHFAKDYYIANGQLLPPRKILIVPNAYGGTRLLNLGLNGWGVNPGRGGSPAVGSLVTNLVTRANLAKALSGTNTIVALDWHQGEGDIAGYATLTLSQIRKYRWALMSTMKYLRAQIGGNFPIVMGRMSNWTINTGDGVNYIPANTKLIDKIVRAMARRLPYVGIADSITPSALTDGSSVHFDAQGQRDFSGRYWTAYGTAKTNANFPTSPTWDDIDVMLAADGYTAGFTITNGGLDLSGDANSAWKTALATMPNTSATDKVYWEVKCSALTSATNLGYVGICNQDFDIQQYLGNVTGSNGGHEEAAAGIWALAGQASSVTGTGSSPWALRAAATLAASNVANDRMMFALNRATGKCWVGKNGTWLNSGDPAAGTNEWINGIPTTDSVYIAASIYTGTTNTWRIQAKSGEFGYSPPSGFVPWGA